MMDAQAAKDRGNEYMKAKEYKEAVSSYSEAIALDSKEKVFYSNRCAAYLNIDEGELALADAEMCINIDPQWAKSYSRKAAALAHMRRYDEAIEVLKQGLTVLPGEEALAKTLSDVLKVSVAYARTNSNKSSTTTNTTIVSKSRTSMAICGVNRHDCGYCKQKEVDSSVSYGIISETMNVRDYQSLMLIGWRRCGTYYYKPAMHETCCPMYTIRLPVNKFQKSKSHRKLLGRVDRAAAAIAAITATTTASTSPAPITATSIGAAAAADDDDDTIGTNATSNSAAITMGLEEASFTLEKYNVYRKYQIEVHGDEPDDVSESGFTRFLVDSSLVDNPGEGSTVCMGSGINSGESAGAPATSAEEAEETSLPSPRTRRTAPSLPFKKYGTHHQLYRLNGKLIGVGVIDILPLGVSSVYFYYDTDYKNLVLGKYSALQEIEFCQKYGFLYYYMGYYIHTCSKMKYKGEYQPSELLCPTTLNWVSLSECIPLLNQYRFCPFLDPSKKLRLAIGAKKAEELEEHEKLKKLKKGEEEAAAPKGPVQVADKETEGDTSKNDVAKRINRKYRSSSGSDVNGGGDGSSSSDFDNAPGELDILTAKQQRLFWPKMTEEYCKVSVSPAFQFDVGNLDLDIGAEYYVKLKDLRPTDAARLQPKLQEFLNNVGAPVCGRAVVKLC